MKVRKVSDFLHRMQGGVTQLRLSSNGVDWTDVTSTDRVHPYVVTPEQAQPFLTKSELWVQIVINNTLGPKTGGRL